MERFPNEILLNIFQHLSIYSQHQCLQVCRSWNAVARTFTADTTQKIVLNGYEDIRRFARVFAANPAQGLAIRQIRFNMLLRSRGDQITKGEFINLMNKCPRLAEISLAYWDPVNCFGYLCEHDVRLPQLEAIHLVRSRLQYWPRVSYMNLLYKYRATINQMCICVDSLDISRLGLDNITDYLRQFPCLKYLSLDTSCHIVFDALIQACPQLQVLRIKMRPCGRFKVMANERNNSIMPALNPASQLETLKISGTLISQQLYQYLKHCCTFLSHLVITLTFASNLDQVIRTFDAFQGDICFEFRPSHSYI